MGCRMMFVREWSREGTTPRRSEASAGAKSEIVMKKLDNNTAVKKTAATITPNTEAFWWNDDERPQGARMEQLEHRRLMSGGLATNSGEESNAAPAAGYEFDLGHRAAPALPPSLLTETMMLAPDAFADNFHNA